LKKIDISFNRNLEKLSPELLKKAASYIEIKNNLFRNKIDNYE